MEPIDIERKEATGCGHPRLRAWFFEDSRKIAGMWSCADCGRRFEPVAPAAAPAMPVAGQTERQPMTEAQIDRIRFAIPAKSVTQRDFELARAVERAHGIGGAA